MVSPDEQIRVGTVLDHLGLEYQVQDLLIEGGSTLAWSAVEEDVVDRFVLYLAPKLIGGETAPSILGGKGFDALAEARALDFTSVSRLGPDLKVVADVHRDR